MKNQSEKKKRTFKVSFNLYDFVYVSDGMGSYTYNTAIRNSDGKEFNLRESLKH